MAPTSAGGALPTGVVSFAAWRDLESHHRRNVAGDTLVDRNRSLYPSPCPIPASAAGPSAPPTTMAWIRNDDDASLSIAATRRQAEGQAGSTAFNLHTVTPHRRT
jgi:hypothetical protein